MGILSFFGSLRLPIKNGGFAEGIKGRINLVRRRKLKSSAFQLIYALPPLAWARALVPADSVVAAQCEQFESIRRAIFILKTGKAKNECICLKCGVFT
jgi:hypothetical protein